MLELSIGPYVTTVAVSGRMDVSARQQFPEITARISKMNHRLLAVDLCQVTALDSVGVAFLSALSSAGTKRGRLTVLRGCSDDYKVVIRNCGGSELFRFDDLHLCPTALAS